MPKSVVLTKRLIDAANARDREFQLWDAKLRGFGLRVHPSGTKTFILKRRTTAGRQVKITVGRYGELTVEQGRDLAAKLTADLIRGNDPAQAKRVERRTPRFDDFAHRYLTEHCEVQNKPSTLRNNRSNVERILMPFFGAKAVSEITYDDVLSLRNFMRNRPYQANRTVALLRHMMNWAEQLGIRPRASNPCPKGTMLPEKSRRRSLSDAELIRLAHVLTEEEAKWKPLLSSCTYRLSIVFAIRLLVLTGARLSEILTLKWDYVDLDRHIIELPDSKTGPKRIYLSSPAIDVLKSIPRLAGNVYVITGRDASSHLINLEKPWRRIRAAAGLRDVRLHDLRHTYASYGIVSGHGLPIIGALLGHRSTATTQRYAHLGNNPALLAARDIGKLINASFTVPQPMVAPDES